MNHNLYELSRNLWRPSSLINDPEASIPTIDRWGSIEYLRPNSIVGETQRERDFLTANPGVLDRPPSIDSFDESLLESKTTTVENAVQRMVTLPDGRPNLEFFQGKSRQLKSVLKRPREERRTGLTPQEEHYLQQTNPVAFDRYQGLSNTEKANVFVENKEREMVVFIPGEGFSSSVDSLEVWYLPPISKIPGVEEIFVAGHGPSLGERLGIHEILGTKQKDGNWYLFGGLFDLGSPGMPGAGTAALWWIPDRILGADMSDYYVYHDEHFDSSLGLSDIEQILTTERDSFLMGASDNPFKMGLQVVYSSATTGASLLTATYNSVAGLFSSGSGASPSPSGGSTAGGGSPSSIVSSIVSGGCGAPKLPPVPAAAAGGAGVDGCVVTVV